MELRSAADLVGLRRSGAVAARALEAARAACVTGATTAAIDAAARAAIESDGGEPLFLGYEGARGGPSGRSRGPYPASTCVSVDEILVHGVPSSRVLRGTEIVSIDLGVRVGDWCADIATTVALGPVTDSERGMIECGRAMLEHAIARIEPGLRWSTIARELERMACDAGFAVAVDFVGHGIGRRLHEPPQVPCAVCASYLEGGDFTLRPGMVLAIEPMLVDERPVHGEDGELLAPANDLGDDGWTVATRSGARSCHFEHTVAVTRDGVEVLTRRNNELLDGGAGANACSHETRIPSAGR
ncbi:MAG: type I methionyl aminopeptidase [Planctomycetota bacterium]